MKVRMEHKSFIAFYKFPVTEIIWKRQNDFIVIYVIGSHQYLRHVVIKIFRFDVHILEIESWLWLTRNCQVWSLFNLLRYSLSAQVFQNRPASSSLAIRFS